MLGPGGGADRTSITISEFCVVIFMPIESFYGNSRPARIPVSNFPAMLLPSSQKIMITLTPKAAEELAILLESRAKTPQSGLRLAVRRGGCAGWQYEMAVGEPEPGDFILESGAARVIVAEDSQERLRGCEIDFSDALSDAGFKINNPNAARSCGCGTSFETADEPPGTHAVADGEACGTP